MNPFEALKDFEKLKEKSELMHKEMGKIVVSGKSGGDMVVVSMNGLYEVLNLKIDPKIAESGESGELGLNKIPFLEELIKAAFADAWSKVKEEIQRVTMNLAPQFFGKDY